jgi:uncharacterized protein (DUF1697 family)
METYISLLKGINVGGHKIIKMALLKSYLESFGFSNVCTYIQSGNIIYNFKKTKEEKLSNHIAQIINEQFGFQVNVITINQSGYKQILNQNPFVKKNVDIAHLHISFLHQHNAITNEQTDKLNKNCINQEEWKYENNVIYFYIPINYSKTKLTNGFVETTLKTIATTRNWKTAIEIDALANENK